MRPITLRVKPGKLKIGASLTSQVVTIPLPVTKIIEQVNKVTKQLRIPLKKTKVSLWLQGGVLMVRNLYPGDSQIIKALGRDNPSLRDMVNQTRASYSLNPINDKTLEGIVKTIR